MVNLDIEGRGLHFLTAVTVLIHFPFKYQSVVLLISLSMSQENCTTCHSKKANLKCGICSETQCKYCVEFNDEDQFSFLTIIPNELQHLVYCRPCFDKVVAPELAKYLETMEKAKNILVYFKKQGKETRLFKRLADPIFVKNGKSSHDVEMRLAFQAVQLNYNAIIDVDIVGAKVRDGSYQTMSWTGSAMPTHVDQSKIIRDRSHYSNPN